jgi:hypothetical protein
MCKLTFASSSPLNSRATVELNLFSLYSNWLLAKDAFRNNKLLMSEVFAKG